MKKGQPEGRKRGKEEREWQEDVKGGVPLFF
jgi:hypothetical protein